MIGPDVEQVRPPTPRELAEKLRDEAEASCAKELGVKCGAELDEARGVDPGGAGEGRVVRMRGVIEEVGRLQREPQRPLK